jgi:tRNA pseudouridine13 synthase
LIVPNLEKKIGIEIYATDSLGVGGRIRQFPEDFVVEEVLVDGSKAKISFEKNQEVRGKGGFLICLLVKKNWDNLLVIQKIARQLKIDPERVRIAGIKDAKAVTAQHVSVRTVTPEQISEVKIEDVSLYPLKYSREGAAPHLLLGNEFHITIRSIDCKSSEIEKRVMNVQDEFSDLGGIPNFFGHQRFGTVRPITHLVGKSVIQGDFKKAALTFLAQSSPYENKASRKARENLQHTQDFQEAFRGFPRYLKYERSMLYHLARHPRDFLGAFRRLPRQLCKLFIHAYQSYLFNIFLSRRILQGIPLNEAQAGDYVVKLDEYGLPIRREERGVAKKGCDVRKVLVALPLLGFKQGLSKGVQGEIEQEVLKTENVVPEDFSVRTMPKLSQSGGLRTALAAIDHLSIKKASEDLTNPSRRKLKLSFFLRRGSYATVVLREFMKSHDIVSAGF